MQGSRRQRRAAVCGLVFLLCCLAACGDQSGLDSLFADGAATAAHLNSYYEVLGAADLDAWKNQTIYDSLLQVPANPRMGDTVEQRIEALKQRAAAARALSHVYSSLAALRDPAALKDVEQAGKNLGDALGGVKQLPGAAAISSDGFSKAAALLANLHRQKEIQRALPPLNELLGSLSRMFDAEKDVYISIGSNRDELAGHLLEAAVKRKLAAPGAILPQTLLGAPVTWPSDETSAGTALAVARITVQRSEHAWSCATQQTSLLLSALLNAQQQALSGSGGGLHALDDDLGQAKACLTEYRFLSKVEK